MYKRIFASALLAPTANGPFRRSLHFPTLRRLRVDLVCIPIKIWSRALKGLFSELSWTMLPGLSWLFAQNQLGDFAQDQLVDFSRISPEVVPGIR